MSQEPVLYDSPKYEHANMAVLFCQEVLTEQGLVAEANQLRGIEVTCAPMARVALRALLNMQPKGVAREAVDVARHLCEQALSVPIARAAG